MAGIQGIRSHASGISLHHVPMGCISNHPRTIAYKARKANFGIPSAWRAARWPRSKKAAIYRWKCSNEKWHLYKWVWNVLLMILKCCFMILKCCVYELFKAVWWVWNVSNALSTSLNNCGSLKNLQRGGALKRPAPLCRFFLSQNSSNCCLSLVFFPFNPFWLAGALKNYILDLGLTQKWRCILQFGIQHLYFVVWVTLQAS